MTDPRPSDGVPLPCPFCAYSSPECVKAGKGVGFHVGCGACHASMFGRHKAEAIDAWNHRATLRVLPSDAQIDDLWLHRTNLHGGDIMPQLRDFARALLAAASEPTERKVMEQALEALTRLVARINANGGIGAYECGPAFVMEPAIAAIAALRTALEK